MNRQILSLLAGTFENYLGQEAFEEHLAYYNFRNDPSTVLHCETNSYFRATLMFHPCAEPTIYFQSISPLFCIRVGVTNTWHGNQRTTGTWRLSNYRRIKYGPLILCCTTRKYFSLSYFEKNSFFSLSFLLNLHFWVCDRSRGYSRRPSKLPMMHWIPIYRTPYPPTPSTPTPLSLTLAHRTPQPCHPACDIWWPSLETCSNLFIEPHCTDPLVLTSGGYRSMYSWQAGGMHPTGMLSFIKHCFHNVCRFLKLFVRVYRETSSQ